MGQNRLVDAPFFIREFLRYLPRNTDIPVRASENFNN